VAKQISREKKWTQVQGRRLRQRREGLALSLPEFKRMLSKGGLEVSIDSLRHWEQGENEPRQEHLVGLAKALKISPQELLATVLVQIPTFPKLGISWYRVFPLPNRSIHVSEPVFRQLKEQGFDYLPSEFFGIRRLWERVGLHIGHPVDDNLKREFLRWARSAEPPKALVLEGFQGSEPEWKEYLMLISDVRTHCHVILIQAVEPFHCLGESNRNSLRRLEPIRSDIPLDDEPSVFAEALLDELPFCCLDTLRDILSPSTFQPTAACVQGLLEAGVLRRIKGGLDLCHEAWREPWTKRLLAGK
jgi:transcriptional regulator with XRE-family HTH domain